MIFFLELRHDFPSQVIESASATKIKGIIPFLYQSCHFLYQSLFNCFFILYCSMTYKATRFTFHSIPYPKKQNKPWKQRVFVSNGFYIARIKFIAKIRMPSSNENGTAENIPSRQLLHLVHLHYPWWNRNKCRLDIILPELYPS